MYNDECDDEGVFVYSERARKWLGSVVAYEMSYEISMT